jgi:hypothetical protein
MKKTVLVDDIDGGEAEETVKFGIDGDVYEVDLSSGNAEKLRAVLAPYRKVGRPTRLRSGMPKKETPASSTGRRRPAKRQANGSTPTSAEIRSWAAKKRIKVNATGRIPNAIVEQYAAEKGT